MSPSASNDITTPQPPQLSVGLYRRIATLFVVLTVGIVAVAVYVVFARATVVILSEPDEVVGEFIVDVAMEPTEGEVVGAVFVEELEIEQTFPATSVVTVETHAEGTVRIISSLFRSQTLVESTRILTPDGILFRLKDRVVIPAYGSVEVDAFADEAGEVGAVGDATFTIPGLNPDTRRFFEVETVEPIVGGKTEVRMVTGSDLEKAEGVLTQKLKDTLTEMFREKAGEKNLPTDAEMLSFLLVEKKADAEAGDEVEEFTLLVRVEGTAVYYQQEGFDRRVEAALNDRIPFDRTLKEVNKESLIVELEKTDILGGRANLRVSASGLSIISPDAPVLDPEKITGVSTEAAVQYLEAIEGVSSASVDVRPFWAGRLPNVAENIRIEVR